MARFDRHLRIPGWEQGRFTDACVAVSGRGWLGAFAVWGLCSLGVGRIAWLGRPRTETGAFAGWLLSAPCPVPGARIEEFPSDLERAAELEWVVHGSATAAVLVCDEGPTAQSSCLAYGQAKRIPILAGHSAAGGWFGTSPPCAARWEEAYLPVALALAGVLVDAARVAVCPLENDLLPEEGALGLSCPPVRAPDGAVLLAGAGGIGVYAATVLAALGLAVHLEDPDAVELSNLNRQGLFGVSEVNAPKSEAAAVLLSRLFPRAEVTAGTSRVDASYALPRNGPRQPLRCILSAVDNASSRLAIQTLGRSVGGGVPVAQGGTDLFAADVFTQDVEGPLLDEQMHGALSAAAAREEAATRSGRCATDPSYVVPGMVAGALVAHRTLCLFAGERRLPPVRWRAGSLPSDMRRETHE